jgi:hypothetical protein
LILRCLAAMARQRNINSVERHNGRGHKLKVVAVTETDHLRWLRSKYADM